METRRLLSLMDPIRFAESLRQSRSPATSPTTRCGAPAARQLPGNPAAGSLDKFCIEPAMIESYLSRHGADKGAMLVSQFVLLVVGRHYWR